MKRRVIALFTILFHLSLFLSNVHAVNPKPADGDFSLPMPGGDSMVFRPVFIGKGSNPFAFKEFTAGRAGSGFKEFPTHLTVGGSFVAKNRNGTPDWLYYLGKYEVTEAQYYSVMEPGKKKGSLRKPITSISWFQAMEFINRYNLWLFRHALDSLPQNDGSPGFVRLPTEAEWEFAARGGVAVDAVTFDKKTPYPDQLSRYEWFSGPKSSHGKLQNIGKLKANPLGLHDMLGNVSEMTFSPFMIEYYQGRTGGFVSKGGNYLTSEKDMRSSLRSEMSFYRARRGTMSPTSQPMLGLRLVISSPIFVTRNTYKKIASAWSSYQASRKPPALPGKSSSVVESLKQRIAELEKALERQKQSGTDPDALKKMLAQIKNLESQIRYKNKKAAFSWFKVASDATYMVLSRDIAELPRKEAALKKIEGVYKSQGLSKLKKTIDSIQKQISDMRQNIDNVQNTILLAFKQLSDLPEISINEGLREYQTYLKTQNSSNTNIDAQIKVTQLIMKYYKKYLKTKTLDSDSLLIELKQINI